MNEQKKAFADLIISGTPPIEAALSAFSGISRKTARNKSSALLKEKDIQDYIKDKRDKIGTQVETIIQDELAKDVANKKSQTILTAIRKRQLLDEIAEGRKTFEKVIIIDGKIKRIKCKPTPMERLKAIEMDNKMAGDNVQAKPNQIAKAQEIEKVVVVEDNTPQYGEANSNK